jgi:multicomponent Na+:H+ antiporter subunit F
MQTILMALACTVLMSVVAGLFRVVRGPTSADRMLSSLLFGTGGVAVLLLLAEGMQAPALKDVALVFVVLAAVSAVAFVRLIWMPDEGPPQGNRP